MADGDDTSTIPDGLSLCIQKPSPPLHPARCIICQKAGKTTDSLHGGPAGRKRVRDVAELRNDYVKKRLKILGPDFEFKYHNTYSCYKKYSDIRNLPTIPEEYAPNEATEVLPSDFTPQKISTRSTVVPRPGPSTNVDRTIINCVICASDRVWVKSKGAQVREKFRLCKSESAHKFVNAMHYHKDDVYTRCSDLDTIDDVFAADLYCHVSCFKQYVSTSKHTESNCEPKANPKADVFSNVISRIDPLIQTGYGFTMTEIREMMLVNLDDSVDLYNRDVKKMLADYYGNKIQFCPSNRVNESEMCFSADITVEDLTRSLRNKDVVRSAGEILRDSFMQVDFKLNDRFCDGNELKESWENTHMPDDILTFFSSLFGIRRSRMLQIEMLDMVNGERDDVSDEDDDGGESSDDTSKDVEWAVRNQHNQLNCLFQIMYNQLFHGTKKTPLTTSFGQYQYGKSRSREILTATSHIGISPSYNDVRRSRRLLAAYAVAKSEGNDVPVPSTFTCDAYTFGAMDNGDFSDRSSISGTKSDHVTMQVLYQDASTPPESKPRVSEMNLKKSTAFLPVKLPCQEVPTHPKSSVKPSLPASFKVIEDTDIHSNIDCVSAFREADQREFLISFIRLGLPNDATCGTVPTWGGTHALLSTATVPVMRVGFMPVIPSPVTDYATVRKALQNFQSVRRQLVPSQSLIPVFCDEGVYHTVADIMITEPNEFSDIHGMMGMFHWVKILLKCAGRYIRGSGIEEALIETEVFGKLTLNSVLDGSHYVRSFQGIMMVSDLISLLTWEAFWQWVSHSGREINDDMLACATKVHSQLCEKKLSVEQFSQLVHHSSSLHEQFECFMSECCARSELCQYLQQFQHIATVIKLAVASDREGNFRLHLASAEKSLAIFRESDCLNYLRYGTFYLETTKVLEATHPGIFQQFMSGRFVVKDRAAGSFNAVAPDMKLEQSIQRSSKSAGGIVGQTRNLAITVEWQLIFHEILLVSNIFREMVNDVTMNHSESANVHHELTGCKASQLNENVARLLDFVRDRGNPYIIQTPGIKLHNIITKQLVDEQVAVRLLQMQANGDRLVREFREERFLQKTKKLSATISKRNLPHMDYTPAAKAVQARVMISPKLIAAAQRDIEIVKERGMALNSIYGHDILPTSTIFEGHLPSKPNKSALIADLEKLLTDDDKQFPGGDSCVILDFMSKIRSFPKLASFGTFDRAISCALSAGHAVCSRTSLHIVFDSYLELSIKSGERLRRAGGVGSVDLTEITKDVPIPHQLDKFWASSTNKIHLQQLVRRLASSAELANLTVVLSGCITDEEVVPAHMLQVGRPSTPLSSENAVSINVLTSDVEEADHRIVLHCNWEVNRGSRRLLVISNDTDTIVSLLRFMPQLLEKGLQELWVEFGPGEHRRHLPIHVLADKLGVGLCRVIVKAHVLTGDDTLSKIGTKHASLSCEPHRFLADFAESDRLTEEVAQKAEEYLVRVWAGAKSKTEAQTFDELRVEWHFRTSPPKPLEALPPTSSVIHGHIRRAFFVVRNVICLLNDPHSTPDPMNYGWVSDNGILLPAKCLNPLPHGKLVICKCMEKCDTKRCPCKKAGETCVVFCHKQQKKSECQNR